MSYNGSIGHVGNHVPLLRATSWVGGGKPGSSKRFYGSKRIGGDAWICLAYVCGGAKSSSCTFVFIEVVYGEERAGGIFWICVAYICGGDKNGAARLSVVHGLR